MCVSECLLLLFSDICFFCLFVFFFFVFASDDLKSESRANSLSPDDSGEYDHAKADDAG